MSQDATVVTGESQGVSSPGPASRRERLVPVFVGALSAAATGLAAFTLQDRPPLAVGALVIGLFVSVLAAPPDLTAPARGHGRNTHSVVSYG
jgi:hypothetical protein